MRVFDRFLEIAHRRAVRQHDMDIDREPLGMEALGIGHAVRAIKRVVRRLGVEHGAAIGLDHLAPGDEQVLDIIALDAAATDFDFDLGGGAG